MPSSMHVRIKKNDFDRLRRQSPQKIADVLGTLAEEGRTIVVLSMQASPATGNTCVRGGKSHTASSPGNAPRIDSGDLVGSMIVDPSDGGMTQRIIAQSEHAAVMEFGDQANNIAPRPFMRPMMRRLEQMIPDFFDRYLED